MADDKTLTDNDDEIDIVEVDQLPKPGETPPAAAKPEPDEDDEDAAGDNEEDARLVADDDDDEDDAPDKDSPAHKKRVKRRQIQKQARDRTLAELAELRAFKQTAEARFASLETNVVAQNESQVDARLTEVRNDISMADRILAKAIEAGNGEDAAAALRLRDEGKAAELELLRTKGNFTERKQNAPDPVVISLSNEWKAANAGWYGADPAATQIANQIDAAVATDGYDPKTPAYWQELSRRLQARFSPADAPRGDQPKKKSPPPQGQSREHVPPSTRREVYVTPERKQAMVDAGIWDDVPRRNKMLKAYADFDRDQSAS